MRQAQTAVSIARTWIGTPYIHQASSRGAGTDCLGLLRGIWRELYGSEPVAVPAYSADWDEPQGMELLWRSARNHLQAKPLGVADSGDILLFRMRTGSVAKHLGIQAKITTEPTFIHAYSGHGVVESSLSEPWSRRIVARFRFPEENY